jgi:hypothetical protein
MKKKFKNGLIKSSQSTNSLIITNGRNKLVGEAVEEKKYDKIDVIGIMPSHLVACRHLLENENYKQVKKGLIIVFCNFVIYFVKK